MGRRGNAEIEFYFCTCVVLSLNPRNPELCPQYPLILDTGSPQVVQDGLELAVLLPQFPR